MAPCNVASPVWVECEPPLAITAKLSFEEGLGVQGGPMAWRSVSVPRFHEVSWSGCKPHADAMT